MEARIPSIGAVYRHFAPSARQARLTPGGERSPRLRYSDDDLREAYALRMKLDQPS